MAKKQKEESVVAPNSNPSGLTRDANGYGALLGFKDFHVPSEGFAPGAVVNGNEIAVVFLIHDESSANVAAEWLGGEIDISAWNPPAPEGDGWTLAMIGESKDGGEGPFAVWARPDQHGVLTGKVYAQEFLLGSLIKATTKHLKTLSKPWIDLKENEQRKVLHQVQQDCTNAVHDAIDIIASNGRLTFPAAVDQVVFKDGVKAVLTLAKTPAAHSLADAEGSYVTIVIEERSALLGDGDSMAVDADQKPLFDTSTEPEQAAA